MTQSPIHPLAGYREGQSHIFPLRIHMEDTDAGGITYYANYVKFSERARAASLVYLGSSYSKLLEEWGIMFIVRKCSVDYLAPSCLDDDLKIVTTFGVEGRLKVWADQEIRKSDQTLVELKTLLVCVDKNLKPTKIPEPLLDILKPFTRH